MLLVDDHHFLPLLAHWKDGVTFTPSWTSEVERSIRGHEARATLRQWPRATLKFVTDVSSTAAWQDLRSRLVAALRVDHLDPAETDGRTGRACVPWAGRESWLLEETWTPADEEDHDVTLLPTHWPWAVDDRAVLMDSDEEWAVVTVTAVDGEVLTLHVDELSRNGVVNPVSLTPLFFGRFANLPLELPLDAPAAGVMEVAIASESYEIDESAWPPEGDEDEPPELPIAEFDYVDTALVVEFDGSVSTPPVGVAIIGYEWDFGDGTGATGVGVTHEFPATGDYLVRLTVHDELGREAIHEETVHVDGPTYDPDPLDPPDPPTLPDPGDPPPAPPPPLPPPEDYDPPIDDPDGSGPPVGSL